MKCNSASRTETSVTQRAHRIIDWHDRSSSCYHSARTNRAKANLDITIFTYRNDSEKIRSATDPLLLKKLRELFALIIPIIIGSFLLIIKMKKASLCYCTREARSVVHRLCNRETRVASASRMTLQACYVTRRAPTLSRFAPRTYIHSHDSIFKYIYKQL